jgi:tetratricopeptide (TPR) repeat protein
MEHMNVLRICINGLEEINMAKKAAEKNGKPSEKKVVLPGINTSLNNAKVWITWVIILAFVGTSGIVIGLGIFQGNEKDENTPSGAPDPMVEFNKRIDADIAHWVKEVSEDPENANAYFNLGEAYQRKKEHETAIKNFEKALELNKDSVIYRKYLALSYGDLKEFDKSLKVIDEAMKRSPDDHTLYKLAGSVYFQKGDLKKAEEILRKALEMSPGELETYTTLAFIQKEMGNADGAKKSLNEGLKIAQARNDQRSAMIMSMMLEEFDKPKVEIPSDKDGEKKDSTSSNNASGNNKSPVKTEAKPSTN